MPAVTLAGALALAGCGGGGGTTTTVTPVPPPQSLPGGASIDAEDADGVMQTYTCGKPETESCTITRVDGVIQTGTDGDSITSAPVEIPDPNTSAELRRAIALHGNAGDALSMSEKLLKDATDYSGKLEAHDVGGSSAKAKENAEKVLAARAAIIVEQGKAKTAEDALKKLYDEATDDDKAEIKKLYDQAVERHEAITEILEAKSSDDGSLMAAEDAVKARTKITDSDEEIAQGKANNVADRVRAALSNADDDDNTARALGTAAAAPGADNLLVSNTSTAPKGFALSRAGMSGQTFEEITGESSLSVTTLGTAGPFRGTGINANLSANTPRAATYRGIPGRLICAGTIDCTFNSSTGAVTAGEVIFYPDEAETLYVQALNGGQYSELTNGAVYGYWLTETDMVALHAETLSTAAAPVWAVVGEDGPDEATYKGEAAGYSYRETGEGDDLKKASGEFTANVELEATFGTSPALEGSISGFKGVGGTEHVNTSWYVTLEEDASISGLTAGGDVTDGEKPGMEDATSGSWNAHAYGEADKNPAGLVGAFSAGFDDGNAAGVYHAEAE